MIKCISALENIVGGLFNHPSFRNPLNFGSADVQQGANIGKITQAVGTPRLVQFSLKYSF